jgi:hypothetical protein
MAKITGEKYELEYAESKSTFYIKVWGFYSTEDAMAFIKDYSDLIKKFVPAKTSMVIDSVGLKTSRPEAKVLLVECIKLYMQLPYKNRVIILSSSPSANLMLKSALKDGGMTEGKDCVSVNNISEAEEYIRNH